MSSYQLPVWIWPIAVMSMCGLAFLRGRSEERAAAVGVLAGWALTMVVFRNRSQGTQWGELVIDLALLGLFVVLALRTRRYWPLFVSGFQLLLVVTHLAHALEPDVSAWAYLTAALVWSYLIVSVIAYAAWTAPRYADSTDEPGDMAGATRR